MKSLSTPNHAYGQIIPNLKIEGQPAPYPVFNEREVRASAGVMFALGISVFWYIYLTKNFTPLYLLIPLYWIEFFIKVAWGPRYSPFGILSKWLVSCLKPEYAGAVQKRFAWTIGLVVSTLMIAIIFIFKLTGPIPLTICTICLTLMWIESSLGICVGCLIYARLINRGIIKSPDIKPACAGGICEPDWRT